jgi:hypothetical protein
VRDTKDEEVIVDMSFVSRLLGAMPEDSTLIKLPTAFRVPLNGYIYKFARLWSKSMWFQDRGENSDTMEPCEMMEVAPNISQESVPGLPPEMGLVRSPMMALRARYKFEQASKRDVQRRLEEKPEEATLALHATSPECDLPSPEGWTDWTKLGP